MEETTRRSSFHAHCSIRTFETVLNLKHSLLSILFLLSREQFDLHGGASGDDVMLKQAMDSIRRNKVALKGNKKKESSDVS